MRIAFAAILVSSLLPSLALADSPFTGKAGTLTFAVDRSRSTCKFLSDAPAEKISGTAKSVSGEFIIADAANPAGTTGKISVPVANMETGNGIRDSHLRGPDWLNGGNFPNLTYAIQNVSGLAVTGNRASGKANGSFGMNGKTKDIIAGIDLAYAADKNLLKVTSKFSVSLKDFAIKGKAGVVGNKVGETIAVECTIYASAK